MSGPDWNLLFKHELAETGIAVITALFLAFPSQQQTSPIPSRLIYNATASFILTLCLSHVIISTFHMISSCLRGRINMRKHAVRLSIVFTLCDN